MNITGTGWQVHLEDLAASLTSDCPVHPEGWSDEEAAPQWKQRWEALTPDYRDGPVS